MKAHKKLIGLGLLALTVQYSCIPSRQIREVETALPATYANASNDTVNTGALSWREFFAEPELQQLIDTALVRNQELNITLQQVAMAQNEIRARKGEYLPFIGFQGGYELEKASLNTRNGAVEEQLTLGEAGEAFPDPLSNYHLGFAASWELDVWNKLRNAKKAAVFEYLASVEGKNFMVTNLVAEIASLYYELIALDNQLIFVQKNLDIQQNALSMVKLQKQAARATELAVKRFEAEVMKNQSHLFELKQQIVETENQINFLLGRRPMPILRNSHEFVENQPDNVHEGIPSQLLQNRPDIRRAELELEAAKLNVKSARASFYPSIGLRAGVGFEAFNPNFLFTAPESMVYNAVGDLVAPLVNRNALKAAFNTANNRQLGAIYEFERAILNGYVEVTNQLSNIENLNSSFSSKSNQVEALDASIDLANRLFRSARAEYLEVLLTQREALEARMELVEVRKDQFLARIDLYRALGGGWN